MRSEVPGLSLSDSGDDSCADPMEQFADMGCKLTSVLDRIDKIERLNNMIAKAT